MVRTAKGHEEGRIPRFFRSPCPVDAADGALLFHLISKLREKTSLIVTINLSFSEWSGIFDDSKIITALLNRLTHRYDYLIRLA
jgi:DNA replication protein DnaC